MGKWQVPMILKDASQVKVIVKNASVEMVYKMDGFKYWKLSKYVLHFIALATTIIQALQGFGCLAKLQSKFSLPTFGKFELVFFLIELLEIFSALESLSFLWIRWHGKFVQEKVFLKS